MWELALKSRNFVSLLITWQEVFVQISPAVTFTLPPIAPSKASIKRCAVIVPT